MVSCPLPGHGRGLGDRKPSVSVTEGDDSRALVNCQAGCQTEDIVAEWGLNMSDLFENQNGHRGGGSYTSRETTSTDQPATLENYAAYIRVPVEFLKSLGLKEYRHLGEPAVSMPYLDENGEVLLTRSRVSLTGKPKVKTRKGDKHRLYGLWKLEDARRAGYAWIVEGESDWQEQGLVFPSGVGTPLSGGNLNRTFKATLQRAGLPKSTRFHDLRHTCATLLLKQGVNPKFVQELLGHADISLTLNVYSHVLPDMGDAAAGAMDAALG